MTNQDNSAKATRLYCLTDNEYSPQAVAAHASAVGRTFPNRTVSASFVLFFGLFIVYLAAFLRVLNV